MSLIIKITIIICGFIVLLKLVSPVTAATFQVLYIRIINNLNIDAKSEDIIATYPLA